MQESAKEWNISFAGCGFLMAYYCGVYSCLFERAQFLLKGVTKICGASSGALMGAVIACQMSPAKCSENLLEMSREARKGTLGAVHPSFNLLKIVRNFLSRDLPDDAHLLANGRLYVSLTRVSDGTNVLVSEFDSKEDLIQALICSCFYPLYCGVMPPSYHGIRYVDGALSDNMPFSSLRETITISPFSGESDISPYGNPFYFHEIYYNNVSIHINFINAHRVVIAFFPPEPEVLAEMCQNGYRDAFIFLQQYKLLKLRSPLSELWDHIPTSKKYICENKPTVTGNSKSFLPESIKKVFCKSRMMENEEIRCPFSVKLVSCLMWCILPVEMVHIMLLRLAEWTPEMCKMTIGMIGRIWKRAFLRRYLHSQKCPTLQDPSSSNRTH
ncbi:patatin-like phospholipase domain-containing protein 2 isoform X1 [Rhinichthys klamathensis goyatoka]|uniref:patatin-like phospholipase domain-containing protein 2 isoform X1 n=1 Tax=Rhinichthys klamathensis goyatoka TaxID=3034132 RepID=UPI0024B50B15|nr:patatin-like phospholipase domain-containing protein 2 isoform X1 [Rhinichthys klamathensis goyatoka]